MALLYSELEIRCGAFDPVIIMGSDPNTLTRLAYPSFAPPVGRPDNSLLKTYPCKPAQWDMTFNIHGEDAEAVYAELEHLTTMLSYVELWRDNNLFYARPYIYYVPKGSTNPNVAYLSELTRLDIPTTLTDAGANFVLNGVRVSFTTTGGYFPEAYTEATVGTNQDSLTLQAPLFASFALPDLTIPSLLEINIDGYLGTGLNYATTHHVFINRADEGSIPVSGSSPIFVNSDVPAFSALFPEYTVVADSAGNRAPHNVYRFTPASPATYYSGTPFTLGISTNYPALKIYALLRANSAVGFSMKIDNGVEFLPAVGIPYNNGNTQLVYLGSFTSPLYAVQSVNDINFSCSATGIGTMDILKFIAVADQPESALLTLYDTASWGNLAGTGVTTLKVDPRPSVGIPLVMLSGAVSGQKIPQIDGNPYIHSKGPQVFMYHLALNGTAWRQDNPLRFRYRFRRLDHRVSPK